MAISESEVSAMVACAQKNKRFLMEAIWSRYLPGYIRALDLIKSGEIGEVKMISAHFGFTMDMSDPKPRLIHPDLAAGAIWDVGIYPLSLIQDIYQEDPLQTDVLGQLSSLGVEDRCAVQLNYGDDRFAQMSCAINLTTPNHALITGTKGHVVMEDFWKCERFSITREGSTVTEHLPPTSTGLYHEIVGVHRHIRDGLIESPRIPFSDSLNLARLMDQLIHKSRIRS